MSKPEESKEHLSCLMDGELTRDTSLFVVRRIGADADLRATWNRYHVVRQCLRQPGALIAASGFAERLSDQIRGEELPAASATRAMPRWLRPAASLALTATVAAMAVVLVQPGAPPGDGGMASGESIPGASSATFTAPAGLPLTPLSQPAAFSPATAAERARLDAYLLRHNQVAGSVTRQGFVPFLPMVVATDAEASAEEGVTVTEATAEEATAATADAKR